MLKKEKKRVKNTISELEKAGIRPPPTPQADSAFDSQNGFYSDATPPSTTQSNNQKTVTPIKMNKQDEARQKKIRKFFFYQQSVTCEVNINFS